jgi:hypothetical protein
MEEDITWRVALKAWWSFFWRYIAFFAVMLVFLLGISVILSLIFKPDRTAIIGTVVQAGYFLSIVAQVFAMRDFLRRVKKIGGYRLTLVKDEAREQQ